jgi:cystathionine beta-lyase/cystathionine gamma-synthase
MRNSGEFSTRALHAAEPARRVGEPTAPAPVLSTSYFAHPDSAGFSAEDMSADAPHFYTRWSNPTVEVLERRLADLEGGEAAVAFASGMGAISALFFGRLKAGDHLLIADVCYAGAAELAWNVLTRFGVEVSVVDASDPDRIKAALRPNTRLVHLESPANPVLKLVDIAAAAQIVHAAGAELSVDATIATPVGQRTLALGADFVVHSLTKYICGHGDALGGILIGRAEPLADIRRNCLSHIGAAMAPFNAWLILRGLETLAPRMALHESNARKVAECLAGHPKVGRVNWPGLDAHPQAALARAQMRNFSGLLSFTLVEDSGAAARRFAEQLRVVTYAVSLGKSKSLLFYIPTDDLLRSSFRLDPQGEAAYRALAGEGVFRLSVGLEDAGDIIADLEQALS